TIKKYRFTRTGILLPNFCIMNKKVTKDYLDSLVLHDVANGIYKHNRESFTNEKLFELEMKYIFENNWVYFAHESQISNITNYYFTNEELFELEIKYIFENNWVYLAHESQIPNINDYYTTSIGRQSVVITRDKHGELHALINSCTHKGAQLCRYKKGNKSSFT